VYPGLLLRQIGTWSASTAPALASEELEGYPGLLLWLLKTGRVSRAPALAPEELGEYPVAGVSVSEFSRLKS